MHTAEVSVPSPAEFGAPGGRREWVGPAWRLALVLTATALTLWSSLAGEFVYDDLWLVSQNPTIRSLATLPEALGGSYWDFIDSESAARIGYWRPLTAVFLHVGFRLGAGAPWGFHAVSLFLHLAATATVFFLARRLFRSLDVAFWSALIFGLHPVHVESVAWISAVNDPLHGFLCVLAMWTFLRWRERGSPDGPWRRRSSSSSPCAPRRTRWPWCR